MNWGYKITFVIVAFILIMLSMVFVAFKQSNEMIDTNYYEKELKYQSLINASDNLYSISKGDLIKQNAQDVIIQIPQNLHTNFTNGKIDFIRNDDQRKDIVIDFTPDQNGLFIINKARFSSGFYIGRIQWNNDQKPYYREEKISIVK